MLLDIWSSFKTSVIFVTHDVEEAVFLADRIIVMNGRPGRIVADISIKTPRPRNRAWILSDEFLSLKRRCLNLFCPNDEESYTPHSELSY